LRTFQRSQPAQSILDYICELKNIREKDYLGLRYQDHNKHRYWVDLSRPVSHIAKQFKSDSLALRLRFRYYPAEPSHLREDVSRLALHRTCFAFPASCHSILLCKVFNVGGRASWRVLKFGGH
ncbi:FERM protein, partial [Ancylostoma caninum]